MFLRFCLLTILVSLVVDSAIAAERQKPVPKNAVRAMTPAEKEIDSLLRSIQTTIRGSTTYKVQAAATWRTTGMARTVTGKHQVRFLGRNPDKFRLEVSSENQPAARLIVVSDGTKVIRLLGAANVYSETATRAPWSVLQEDALILQSLEASGVEFLMQYDLHAAITSQAVRVDNLGSETVGNQKTHRFRFVLANGREVIARVVEGNRSFPIELSTSIAVATGEKKEFEMAIDTRLDWTFDEVLPDDTFSLAIPAGTRRVPDLMEYMLTGDSKSTAGAPLPSLTLTGLDDQPVTLADYKGKGIVVLYFWATWASPSTATMPELNAFVDEFSKLGIRFLAVNVGEQAADVKSFVAQAGYKGTVVRDPQAQAMAALKIPELPAVAIIAKDGTLHKTEIGTGPAIRDAVRKTLEALLKGNATKGQGVERKR